MSARAWKRRRAKRNWRETLVRLRKDYGAENVRLTPHGVEVVVIANMPVPTRCRPVRIDLVVDEVGPYPTPEQLAACEKLLDG